MPQHPVDPHGGGEVVNDVALSDQVRHQLSVQNRAFDELEIRSTGDVGQILTVTCRQIVEDGDLLAALGQALDEMGADETRAAGDEKIHATKLNSRATRVEFLN